jgi:hypothetical protein
MDLRAALRHDSLHHRTPPEYISEKN